MQHQDLARWIGDYERAWRTPGTALLDALFAPDATYTPAPFRAPFRGRAEIALFWEAERESAEAAFVLAWEPVAVEGAVGAAKIEVRYRDPPSRLYRDLWIVTLDDDGRCSAFEEWPFFPGQLRAAGEV